MIFLTLSIFVYVTWSSSSASQEEMLTNVEFQTGPVRTTNSYLDFGVNTLPTLHAVSVCLRTSLKHIVLGNPFVSYNIPENDSEFSINYMSGAIYVICCSGRLIEKFPFEFPLLDWVHMCIVLSQEELRVYINNEVFRIKLFFQTHLTNQILSVAANGRMVVGQDLDSIDVASFDVSQLIDGNIADFQFYDKNISHEQAVNYTTCQIVSAELGIFDFRSFNRSWLKGNAKITLLPKFKVCFLITEVDFLFSTKTNQKEAVELCSTLGGALPLPRNEEENDKLYQSFSEFSDECSQSWASIFWLGIEGDKVSKKWVSLSEKKELSWNNFDPSWNKVTDTHTCAAFSDQKFNKVWFAVNCDDYDMCAVCRFKRRPFIRVRGLCKKSLIDRLFYVSGYRNKRPVFVGLENSEIFWNDSVWMMTSVGSGLKGTLETKAFHDFPLGLQVWNIENDACANGKISLLFTACKEGSFSCNDGSCIPISFRCNKIKDCKDESDEMNCSFSALPKGYSCDLAPPFVGNNLLLVYLTVNITAIRQFNLIKFNLVLDISHKMSWRDSRLLYKNLKNETKYNKVKRAEAIWLPRLMFRNAYGSPADVTKRVGELFIIRESDPLPDEDTRVETDFIYDGSHNGLLLLEEQSYDFGCQFQLSYYPFDTQICDLIYEMHNAADQFHLIQSTGKVHFNGERRLLEYELVDECIHNVTVNGYFAQKVTLKFKNLSGYYIVNAYLPSIFLAIICFLVFVFDLEDFQDRIMVSLTSLLVMVNLFAQNSEFVPKTSYLKLIDLWYVILIMFDFLVIIVIILIEFMRLELRKISKTSPSFYIRENKEDQKYMKIMKINSISKYIFAILFTLFLVTYFTFCYVVA